MPLIQTADLKPGVALPDQHQIYNGLDCCLTLEIFEEIQREHNQFPQVYDFARAMQGPALDMMLRGFAIDHHERKRGIVYLGKEIERYNTILQTFSEAIWQKSVNPNSTKQLQKLFYGRMKLPEQWISQKGKKTLSMNREALEKLDTYMHARPIVACILTIRDLAKELQTLESELDPRTGRMHSSYNVVGTETGRWSSSKSAYGLGLNAQNVKRKLRRMFTADKGWKLCGIDLKQAESVEVGWLCGVLFNEWSYLDACESGDPHTLACRLIWDKLPWTGVLRDDRKIADQIFYRDFTYRDMAKRGGHGSNYYGTPFTMARHLKVPRKLMEDFQEKYFDAFPGIPKYHRWVAQQLQTTRTLTTVFGRERTFFGRATDDTTLREAIASSPQGATADRLNLGLWRVWHHMKNVQVLSQGYDSLYFQYREDVDEAAIIEQALKFIDIPITDPKSGRTYTVQGEAKVGWNWADVDYRKKIFPDGNPDGLTEWKGSDSRKRTSLYDRIM